MPSETMRKTEYKSLAVKSLKLVVGNSFIYRAIRVLYRQGPKVFFKNSTLFVGQKIRFALGLVPHFHPFSTIENQDRLFNLPAKLPKVSIVSILYNKANEVGWFLESIYTQTYAGEIEIIFINDRSPGKDVEIVERFAAEKRRLNLGVNVNYKIIQNEKNLGNCVSRNEGIQKATGELLIIVDADSFLNAEFVEAHVESHFTYGFDAAIGPMNIETEGRNPVKLAQALSKDHAKLFSRMELQDQTNVNTFLNCITRNFSIKKSVITEDLFDPQFSYSKDPESGFGWEDVEMGYRLYQRGLKIQFLNKTFSLHVSHPSSTPEDQKVIKSIINLNKLFTKHPDFTNVARMWTNDLASKIDLWYKHHHEKSSNKHHQTFLELTTPIKKNKMQPRKRVYNILTYRWHVPHQYELYKTGHRFTLLKDVCPGFTNVWSYDQRPFPANAQFLELEKLNFKDYDLALLHFDENALDWQNCNGILDTNWGANFRYFMENVPLPKVAICHGTPQFYGQYNNDNIDPTLKYKVIEESRQKLVEYTKDIKVVCNSYQAHSEWGFKNSKVIWQGFDPCEYPISTYEEKIVSLGKAIKERPHYRGYEIYKETFKNVPDEFHPKEFKVKDPFTRSFNNTFAVAKYYEYINEVRKHSIYFNPTIRSPMPRSRGEAMMCGLSTVSLNNHDVNLFIKNGINGFYSNDPAELAEYLNYLLNNPSINRKIGMEGRRTSLDMFNLDRYLSEWQKNFHDLSD
ncbi:MAG: glycosyltransferase [Bdellovibrionaceae bacterium]|nr:glycosyltransferase [Pseudobdellovibrionaceae bacterium]